MLRLSELIFTVASRNHKICVLLNAINEAYICLRYIS